MPALGSWPAHASAVLLTAAPQVAVTPVDSGEVLALHLIDSAYKLDSGDDHSPTPGGRPALPVEDNPGGHPARGSAPNNRNSRRRCPSRCFTRCPSRWLSRGPADSAAELPHPRRLLRRLLAQTDPNDGAWHWRPTVRDGAYWYPNGLGVGVDCARAAAGHTVVLPEGRREPLKTPLPPGDSRSPQSTRPGAGCVENCPAWRTQPF